VPRLTPRDLAVMFCNIRHLHDVSCEVVVCVGEMLRAVPRIDLSPMLCLYEVMLPGLCRYMCNFGSAMETLVSIRHDKADHEWFSQVLK
jgi:hypothetical protein